MPLPRTILDEWDITAEELTIVMEENPSLKGMVFGYVAELKLKERIAAFDHVTYFTKFDDHDRKKKGDLYIVYKGRAFDGVNPVRWTIFQSSPDPRFYAPTPTCLPT